MGCNVGSILWHIQCSFFKTFCDVVLKIEMDDCWSPQTYLLGKIKILTTFLCEISLIPLNF